MTVRELIEQLKSMPPDALAVVEYDGAYLDCLDPQEIAVQGVKDDWGTYRKFDDIWRPMAPKLAAVVLGGGGGQP